LLDDGTAVNDARAENSTSDASVQLKLAKPQDATVLWTPGDGKPAYAVILPGRINVPAQKTAIFQLENLSGHPNLMLFGSFANLATKPAAKTYARHNEIEFTEEDVEQAASGNLVIKVFYLANDTAQTKLEVLAAHRLDPGIDPVQEAEKRGEVLGVLRLGNRHGDVGKNDDWHLKFLEG